MATKLSSGRYRAQVFVGTENGKRIYQSFIADTADEADYQALAYKLGKGKKTESKTLREAVMAYIAGREGILSPATILAYRSYADHFGDYLDIPLSSVTPANLQSAVRDLSLRSNAAIAGKKLSPKTVRNAFGLVNASLRQNGIYLNGIVLPRKERIEYRTPFENDLARIFSAVKGTRIEVPVLLAAWCGLRRSEICGLKYTDIRDGVLHVDRALLCIKGEKIIKNTKTASSQRKEYIPQEIINLIESQRDGEYIVKMSPNALGKAYERALKSHGLPPSRFHDLRHSFVSILIERGISPDYVQSMGGWATDRVMNSVYKQRSFDAMKRQSEEANEVFRGILQHDATQETEKT